MTFPALLCSASVLILVTVCHGLEPSTRTHLIPDLGLTLLVGNEADIKLVIDSQIPNLKHDHVLVAAATGEDIVRILPTENQDTDNATEQQTTDAPLHVVRVKGIHPGHASLNFYLEEESNISRPDGRPLLIKTGYPVEVVEDKGVLQGAFLYVILTSQFLTMLLLAVRMRTESVKEVFVHPCALLGALVCQAVLMPLVSYLCQLRYTETLHM